MVKMMFWQEKNAGCKTVLIGNQDYQQDYTVSSLKEFVDRVL